MLDETQTKIKVRLDAIDAPELGQPFGQAVKKGLWADREPVAPGDWRKGNKGKKGS